MIFTCVGTQLSFQRLVQWVDQWAGENCEEVIAQVGPDHDLYSNLKVYDFIKPTQFDELFQSADCIVSHAGMGSIISAIKFSKPIIVVPRIAQLGEHRNEHQTSTVDSFIDTPGIYVARSKDELFSLLGDLENLAVGSAEDSKEYGKLLNGLSDIFNKL